MEELLNKLIEKGWKPFGEEIQKAREGVYCKNYFFFEGLADGKSLRELVSKDSGLWQFVCENGYNLYKKNYFHWFSKYGLKGEYWDTSDFEYYVLESALCNEEELEKFLLENIKIS